MNRYASYIRTVKCRRNHRKKDFLFSTKNLGYNNLQFLVWFFSSPDAGRKTWGTAAGTTGSGRGLSWGDHGRLFLYSSLTKRVGIICNLVEREMKTSNGINGILSCINVKLLRLQDIFTY